MKSGKLFIHIYNHFTHFLNMHLKLLVYELILRVSDLKADLKDPCGSFRSNADRSTLSLIRVEYAITRAWASGIGPLPVGERSLGQRVVEEADGMSDEERRRDRTAQRKWAVREMAPNRLVCRWTHYLSHADSTDILDARLIALMASLRVRVSRAIRATEAEGGN